MGDSGWPEKLEHDDEEIPGGALDSLGEGSNAHIHLTDPDYFDSGPDPQN